MVFDLSKCRSSANYLLGPLQVFVDLKDHYLLRDTHRDVGGIPSDGRGHGTRKSGAGLSLTRHFIQLLHLEPV